MSAVKDSLFIVTGAGSGIGRALAIQAVNEGAMVIATDVNEKGLDETIALTNHQAQKYLLDVSKPQQIENFARDIIKQYFHHRIILVNNAGVAIHSGNFAETPLDDFEWLLSINLWGVIRMTKAFLPHMVKQNQGHIINVSSVFGIVGLPHQSAYATAKFGVKGFSDVLKIELIRSNVKVSSVHPGGINTNIARSSKISEGQNIEQAKKQIAEFQKALKMSPERAAEIIIAGIKNDKARILVGSDAKLMDWIARVFPNTYHHKLAKLFKM